MKKNNISVIIPHFNDSRIIRLLNSINKTSFREYLHLIIQDGKSDAILQKQILELLKKNDLFISEEDNGIFDAFNKGMDAVKTKYITWLGADDIIDESFNYQAINDLLNQGNSIIQTNIIYFDKFGNNKRIIKAYKNSSLLYKIGLPFYHIGSVLNYSIIKEERFNLESPTCSDFEFFKRIFEKYDLKSMPCHHSNVYLETGGASDKNLWIKIKAMYEMISYFKPKEYYFIPLFIIFRIPMKFLSFLKLK